MRDVIWTLIVFWLVFRLIAVFKNASQKRPSARVQKNEAPQEFQNNDKQKDLRSALTKHLNSEGEYVDYEEIK